MSDKTMDRNGRSLPRILSTLLLLSLAAGCAVPPPNTAATPIGTDLGAALPSEAPVWQSRHLSRLEQAVITQHNLLRIDPPAYAQRFLEPLLSRYRGNYLYDDELSPEIDRVITEEGAAAVEEAINALQQQPPLPLAQASLALTLSAEDHARDQISGRTGHVGSDGSALLTRIQRRGDQLNAVAENIAYGQASARRIINALLIDDGVPDRSHRQALLNPLYRRIGVATMPHQRYGIVTVIHYADQIVLKDPQRID